MTATPGYTALTATVGALTDTGRVVFEIRGDRARRVVNGLLTNAIDGLERGIARYAFALTSKGRPVAEMRVLPAPGFDAGVSDPGPERVWIDVPAAAAESFREHLGRFVPPIFATHRSLEIERVSLVGPEAPGMAAGFPGALGLSPAREPDRLDELECVSLGRGDEWVGLLVRREALEGPGVDVYLPRARRAETVAALERLVTDHGGATATEEDWDIVRIERGIPVYGRDITPDVLPQETGQVERAVSFTKGCYTGQEVVARIHYRGHVNRCLRGVRLGRGTPAAPGDPLSSDGRIVGTLTSTTESPRFGPIALAYVRREIEPDAALETSAGGAARMCLLPFT